MSFGVRVGVGLVTRAWQLARMRPSSAIDVELLLSESTLAFREVGGQVARLDEPQPKSFLCARAVLLPSLLPPSASRSLCVS